MLVGFFSLRDRDRVIRVCDLRTLARHDDPDAHELCDGARTQRDLQIDVRLYRAVRCHCPTVFPAVTGVKDQNLCLLVPVCGCFCLSELPVGSKPAAKHHDRSQQPDKYPMIQRFRHSAPSLLTEYAARTGAYDTLSEYHFVPGASTKAQKKRRAVNPRASQI